jgi:tRNA pseudouridine55 synthase
VSRISGRAVDGLLVVDKPAGPTSHDVVAKVRRLAGTRRVGHAGTLDPMATGVLLIGVGRATRLLGHLALADKAYAATIRLGASTTTDDVEGEVVSRASVTDLSEEQVREALAGFVGSLSQVPSSVSAVKVDGRRAHARVRAGEDVQLDPREVVVHELRVDAVSFPGDVVEVDAWLRCSTGTYVRAIARDVGSVLGVGGHLAALRRTSVGSVEVDEAVPLADLEAADLLPVLPMASVAARFFPTVSVDGDGARDVGFGRALSVDVVEGEPTAVLGPDGSFLALYGRGSVPGEARAVAVFVDAASGSDRSTVSE